MPVINNNPQLKVQDLNLEPIGIEPAPIVNGNVYYDSGSGTDYGAPGLRMATDTGIYRDLAPYIEGTFTPVLGDGTNNFTLSVAVGRYVLVGRLCYVDFTITATSAGSASGDALITMPFATPTTSNAHGFVNIGYLNDVTLNSIWIGLALRGNPNTANFHLVGTVNDAVGYNLQCSAIDASSEIQGSGCYIIKTFPTS